MRRTKSKIHTILALARPEWPIYLVAFLLIAVTNIMDLIWVRMTALAVENVALGKATIDAVWWIMGLALLIFILRWTNRNFSFLAGRRVERKLRTSVFRNTVGMSQDAMDHHRTGDLVSRIINDVTDIRLVLGSGFLQLSNNICAYTFTIYMMLGIRPQLAFAALLPFIPIFFLAKKFTAISYERSRKAQEALGNLSSNVEEAIGGAEVIKSYTAERWQEERFDAANRKHYDAERATALPESLWISMTGTAVWIGIAAILLASGAIIETHATGITIGDITTFIFLFVKLVWPTIALGWIMNVILRGLSAARRLESFIDPPRTAAPGIFSAPADSGISIADVSFQYPTKKEPIITGLDLEIEPGAWVGIVGPTASGKTTLARLIAGLRAPTSGSVKVGGIDIFNLDEKIRSHTVHLATQVPMLFSMNIEENLRLAAPDLDASAMALSIEDVAFGDELKVMPEGLHTRVGEKGLLLSGGQRQRLSLARAFLANPLVMVLDDVLSAVDFTTELKILEGIDRHRAGKTTLFITHRLPVLSRLPRIIVMDAGRIAADGTLAEVLEQSDWLRATFEAERLSEAIASE